MSKERRRRRQEIRLLQRESTWLQKALFALGKAEDARDKLADVKGEADGAEPYALRVGDADVPVDALEDALEERVQGLLETLRERRRSLR